MNKKLFVRFSIFIAICFMGFLVFSGGIGGCSGGGSGTGETPREEVSTGMICGDGVCSEGEVDCLADCAASCGDGVCSDSENATCELDCAASCGDSLCTHDEITRTCNGDCPAPALPAGVIAVDQSATGANNGTSWLNAFVSLESALAASGERQQIWVAEGTYVPTRLTNSTDPKTAVFQLKKDLMIYGGFPSHGSAMEGRNWREYRTILSGDLDRETEEGRDTVGDIGTADAGMTLDSDGDMSNGIDGIHGNNANLIISFVGGDSPDDTALLDGLIITGASSNSGSIGMGFGGGIRVVSKRLYLSNSIIAGNMAENGGGIYSYESLLRISHVDFLRNYASDEGGAFYIARGYALLENNNFINNYASRRIDGRCGGAVFSQANEILMRNVLFNGNRINAGLGGGLCNIEGSIRMDGVVFINNEADGGGAIFSREGSTILINNGTFSNNTIDAIQNIADADEENLVVIVNSIFYNNGDDPFANTGAGTNIVRIGFSLIQGDACPDGITCILDSNVFIEDSPFDTDNLHLRAGSPAIDAGNNEVVSLTTDIDGNPRIVDDPVTVDTGVIDDESAIIDMGAYEYQP